VATGRTRTPSIGSTRALRPERARPRLLFTRVASPRTLSLAASPFCLVKGRQVASSYPALPRAAVPLPARRPRSRRERCVSPTSATDFRHEHPADRSIPGLPRAAPRLATFHDQEHRLTLGLSPAAARLGSLPAACRMSQPGGASLDGEPPASACAATITWYPKAALRRARSLGPGRSRVRWSAILAEPRSTAPSRFTSRRRCSRPLDGLATRPLASPVTTLGGSGIAAVSPSPRVARPGSVAVSSKTTAFAVPGRLPSTSAPSPEHAGRLRVCAWDHEEPATGIAARVLVAFATATRLPARFHPLSPAHARGVSAEARGLDPRPFDRDQAPLVDFCNQFNPRARPRDRPIPAPGAKNGASVRSRAPLASLSGVGSETQGPKPMRSVAAEGSRPFAGPKPRQPTASLHRVRAAPSIPMARGRSPAPPVETVTSRGFTGQGLDAAEAVSGVLAGQLALPAAPSHGCLAASASENATPTRSARTPLVVRPWRRRLESPACVGHCPVRNDAR